MDWEFWCCGVKAVTPGGSHNSNLGRYWTIDEIT